MIGNLKGVKNLYLAAFIRAHGIPIIAQPDLTSDNTNSKTIFTCENSDELSRVIDLYYKNGDVKIRHFENAFRMLKFEMRSGRESKKQNRMCLEKGGQE
jgi:hypothetical protein